jgi:hypothetical protein
VFERKTRKNKIGTCVFQNFMKKIKNFIILKMKFIYFYSYFIRLVILLLILLDL